MMMCRPESLDFSCIMEGQCVMMDLVFSPPAQFAANWGIQDHLTGQVDITF